MRSMPTSSWRSQADRLAADVDRHTVLFTPKRTKSQLSRESDGSAHSAKRCFPRINMPSSSHIDCSQACGGVAPLREYRLQLRFRAPLDLVAIVDSHRTWGAQCRNCRRSNAATGSFSRLQYADPGYARNIELMVLI
jgi:hypothetical protein